MKLAQNFDFNIFTFFNEQYDSDIKSSKNNIGASEIPYGARKTVIKRVFDIKTRPNNKMLFGKLYENLLYRPKVLKALITTLHKKIQFEQDEIVSTVLLNKFDSIPLGPNTIRLHPDVFTNLYTIEIKTTSMYAKAWKELAPYQVAQLNTYMGCYKQKLGFLHKVNIRAFISDIDNEKDGYWEKLWEDYGMFIPIYYDKNLYDITLKRAEFLFTAIEKGNLSVGCPEWSWECGYCDSPVKAHCRNPITSIKLEKGRVEHCCNCNALLKEKDLALEREVKGDPLVFCKSEGCQKKCIESWRFE